MDRTMRSALIAALALALACGRGTGATEDPVEGLYGSIVEYGITGAPDEAQLATIKPFLSSELAGLLLQARELREADVRRAPDEKPAFADGDLFTSLFEGHTSMAVEAESVLADGSRRIVARFTWDKSPPPATWTDTILVREEHGRAVVADVLYGGDWPFANRGSLVAWLRDARRPQADGGVVIELAGGRTVILADDTTASDTYVRYDYRGRVPGIPFHLVHESFIEGQAYRLVHDTTGRLMRLDAPPVVSPDRHRFVTASMDLVAAFDPTRLGVWRIEGDTAIAEWLVEPDAWGPSEVRWLGPDTVAFTANVPLAQPGQTRPVAALLVRSGSAWVLRMPPVP
jgi:hypothetical protein